MSTELSEQVNKVGTDTTEYKEAQSAKVWGVVATVLGLLLTTGAAVAEALGQDTKVGIIVGAVIATAGIVQKTLVQLGYIKSRTDVKVSANVNGVL